MFNDKIMKMENRYCSFINFLYEKIQSAKRLESVQEGAGMKAGKNLSHPDIFGLLLADAEKKQSDKRKELLEQANVKEFFEEGSISINDRTCQGLECELCIKVCPTKALYWRDGTVGIVRELCVYCCSCVLNCIVDDCIRVTRKRPDGEVEYFSKPRDVLLRCHEINLEKRRKRIQSILASAEEYIKRYKK